MKESYNNRIEIDFKNLDNLLVLSDYIKQLQAERNYYKHIVDKYAPLFKLTTEKIDK